MLVASQQQAADPVGRPANGRTHTDASTVPNRQADVSPGEPMRAASGSYVRCAGGLLAGRRKRTSLLLSNAPGGGGWRVDSA